MAVLRIPDENRSLREHGEVRDYLAGIGIDYERWESPAELPAEALMPARSCTPTRFGARSFQVRTLHKVVSRSKDTKC